MPRPWWTMFPHCSMSIEHQPWQQKYLKTGFRVESFSTADLTPSYIELTFLFLKLIETRGFLFLFFLFCLGEAACLSRRSRRLNYEKSELTTRQKRSSDLHRRSFSGTDHHILSKSNNSITSHDIMSKVYGCVAKEYERKKWS